MLCISLHLYSCSLSFAQESGRKQLPYDTISCRIQPSLLAANREVAIDLVACSVKSSNVTGAKNFALPAFGTVESADAGKVGWGRCVQLSERIWLQPCDTRHLEMGSRLGAHRLQDVGMQVAWSIPTLDSQTAA